MGLPNDTIDADFDSQMQGLFREAERDIEHRTSEERPAEPKPPAPEAGPPAAAVTSEPGGKSAGLSLPQLLRPLVQGMVAVTRSTNDNTNLLKRLETAVTATANAATAAASAASAAAANATHAAPGTSSTKEPLQSSDLPQLIADLRGMIESKNGLSQNMFSALHQELKGYKDGFLLESVHRPIIRDLISLYDDITGIQRQVCATISDPDCSSDSPLVVRVLERLRTIETHLDHNLEFIAEVLNRIEVTLMDPHGGKLDKRTQRAVSVEMAEDPDQEGEVVRVVKRGFLWKDRVLRAEEVVVKKYKEGFLVALQAPPTK